MLIDFHKCSYICHNKCECFIYQNVLEPVIAMVFEALFIYTLAIKMYIMHAHRLLCKWYQPVRSVIFQAALELFIYLCSLKTLKHLDILHNSKHVWPFSEVNMRIYRPEKSDSDL